MIGLDTVNGTMYNNNNFTSLFLCGRMLTITSEGSPSDFGDFIFDVMLTLTETE